MTTLTELAASTFNRVMAAHSVDLHTSPLDFSIGEQSILPAINLRGEALSNHLFDLLFPRLNSGIYYHYLTFESFAKVIAHGSLRFFSTKKLSSVGEFIPLCQDLELDGYWRIGADGKSEGEHAALMDDLFYKSFVSCPETNAEKLWDTFAGHGTGVRIAVRIDVHPEYLNFRRVSYQNSSSVDVLKDLLKAFRGLGHPLIPFGISRMPAYHQLKEYAYQNECRLIAKRHPDAHTSFPFQVGRDESQQCNYIDCSLQTPTCSSFQLQLLHVEKGPSCDASNLRGILEKLEGRDRMEADAALAALNL